MASVPPIPPLLCNTPPPIDFDEDDEQGISPESPTLDVDDDDDEFGDFSMASKMQNNTSIPEPALPSPQLQLDSSLAKSSSQRNALESKDEKFNDHFENQLEFVNKENCNSNILSSIPLDNNYLSVKNSSKKSNRTGQECFNENGKMEKLNNCEEESERESFEVIVEDIVDDSDDEFYCNLKKGKLQSTSEENGEDFFAIHMVGDELSNGKKLLNSTLNLVNTNVKSEDAEPCNDSSQFYDFADFESQSLDQNVKSCPDVNNFLPGGLSDNDDDFNDFQGFQSSPAKKPAEEREDDKENQNTENSDEFGDYEKLEDTFSSHFNFSNLKIQLSSLLENVFPPKISVYKKEVLIKNDQFDTLNLVSVDLAKALQYQWTDSEMRHSLIKSLGIDSRNILCGQKWNSSVPRFASNLSFNPLQPQPASLSTSNDDILHSREKNNGCDTGKKDAIRTDEMVRECSEIKGHLDKTTEETKSGEDISYVSVSPEMSAYDCQQLSFTKDSNVSNNNPELQIKDCEAQSTTSEDRRDVENFRVNCVILESLEEGSGLENETVVTSTYAGPLKETHIYTPPKEESTVFCSKARHDSMVFDYETAGTGIKIDETVVKKEYRDVEYNPQFNLDPNSKPLIKENENSSKASITSLEAVSPECDDDFTEFQSVPPNVASFNQQPQLNVPSMPLIINRTKDTVLTQSRTNSPTITENVILSPAILLPKALQIETNGKNPPKIEWGDTVAGINPEELARIEELFPQAKISNIVKITRNSNSLNSTPTHLSHEQKAQQLPEESNSLSISATISKQEKNGGKDDDYWSEFVSVPVNVALQNLQPVKQRSELNIDNNNMRTENPKKHNTISTNVYNTLYPQYLSNSKKHNENVSSALPNVGNSNDDEWSDFISVTPAPSVQMVPDMCGIPQFNSAAWQNANFYNNPLSFYNRNQPNITSRHIHMMQDFSTTIPTRPNNAVNMYGTHIRSNQFQVGNSKVAPSISLIPDLGFVAPTTTSHTSFVNALPTSSNNKK